MNILFIVKNKNEASSRFRVFAYEKYLINDFDIKYYYAEYNNPHLPKPIRSIIKRFRFFYLFFLAFQYDIIFMQRPMSSDKKKSVFFETILSYINPNLIFDFDDALFIQNEKKIKSLISLSKVCICGNQYLADFSKKYNPNTFVIPTPIDTDKYITKQEDISNKLLTIGWTGTSGNYNFFTPELIQALTEILEENKEITFLFICDKKPPATFTFPYTYIPWRSETEVDDLSKIDIGLMPLIESPWTKGKCGFKLIQYGTMSIPAIASNVGVNNEVILDEKSGFIVDQSNTTWKKHLETLIHTPSLCKEMGIKARTHIQKHYSTEVNYPKLKAVLDKTTSF